VRQQFLSGAAARKTDSACRAHCGASAHAWLLIPGHEPSLLEMPDAFVLARVGLLLRSLSPCLLPTAQLDAQAPPSKLRARHLAHGKRSRQL
jgi:hypothetical protein